MGSNVASKGSVEKTGWSCRACDGPAFSQNPCWTAIRSSSAPCSDISSLFMSGPMRKAPQSVGQLSFQSPPPSNPKLNCPTLCSASLVPVVVHHVTRSSVLPTFRREFGRGRDRGGHAGTKAVSGRRVFAGAGGGALTLTEDDLADLLGTM